LRSTQKRVPGADWRPPGAEVEEPSERREISQIKFGINLSIISLALGLGRAPACGAALRA